MRTHAVAIITNIPAPYRVLLFDELSSYFKKNLMIFYNARIEENRKWNIPVLNHQAIFLKKNFFSRFNFYPDIISNLIRRKPEVIIACGFTPTIIVSFIYAKITRTKFIVLSDSWLHSQLNLSRFHKIIRKLIIPKSDAQICIGKKGKEYFTQYGAREQCIFVSPLAIDNKFYRGHFNELSKKKYDIIFSGQFIERKLPFFVIKILIELKKQVSDISFLLIGSGILEKEILRQLKENKINYHYAGFIQQDKLPEYYAQAKVLLFPTQDDPWGVVANEATAVGVPVITNDFAGVANDLIINEYNGYVIDLDVQLWVTKIIELLNNNDLYNRYSQNALKHINNFSLENSRKGIIDAINFVKPS